MYDFVHSWYLIMTNYSLFFFFQNASHRCLDFNFQWSGLSSYFSSSFYSCFSKASFTRVAHHLHTVISCTVCLTCTSAAYEKSHLTQGQCQEAPSSGGSGIYAAADTHATLCLGSCRTVHSRLSHCLWLHSVHYTTNSRDTMLKVKTVGRAARAKQGSGPAHS